MKLLSRLSALSLLSLGVAALGYTQATPVKLATVFSTLLPDAGASGVSWSAGNAMSIRWKTARPVSPDVSQMREGFTKKRVGTLQASVGDKGPVELQVTLLGTDASLERL